jgi:hypothetical protein
MQIGRFFSLNEGRVGQYLSPRVLIVRTPFQKSWPMQKANGVCYFGFNTLSQAQAFMRSLARLGCYFQLHLHHSWLPSPYAIEVWGQSELARLLAHWDRATQGHLVPALPPVIPVLQAKLPYQPVQAEYRAAPPTAA